MEKDQQVERVQVEGFAVKDGLSQTHNRLKRSAKNVSLVNGDGLLLGASSDDPNLRGSASQGLARFDKAKTGSRRL